MQLLKELYCISSPSRKEKKMQKFIRANLKSLGVRYEKDEAGNIYAIKGRAGSYPCIVAHIDEVHDYRSKDFTVMTLNDEVVFGFDPKANIFCGIGADDKNGIWVCLKCLEEFEAIKCVFFIGEEIGCVGSSRAKMPFFEDCRFVLQCDRKGNSDVVRWAGSTELCSAKFVKDLRMPEYGYSITNGMMTDVQELKRKGLKVSCINISCGYYNPHTSNELTRINDLNKCLNFVRHIIQDCLEAYPHVYTPPVRKFKQFDRHNKERNLLFDFIEPLHSRQLRALRKKMGVILSLHPYMPFDKVVSKIGERYTALTYSEFQNVYIDLVSKNSARGSNLLNSNE